MADQDLGYLLVKTHHANRLQILSLREESNGADADLDQYLAKLGESYGNLHNRQTVLPSLTSSCSSMPVDAHMLLEYASKIAKFTRAPPGYNPADTTAGGPALLPWPLDDQMRRGELYDLQPPSAANT